MALSRLENYQSIPSGTILYVSPDSFDATDNIENKGTSPGRPFFSLQRALLEAALLSYQPGRNNDRNDRTTILVSPGTHYIDNRPGLSIQDIGGNAVYKKRTAKDTWTTVTLDPFGETTNFDIFNPNNDLYKYNSVHGGVILPRGTSIVGQDLRKTKIRPLYVPDPRDADVDVSSILNVTGSCYFSQFTFFDADTTKFAYKNYSDTKHVPKFSHHKLTTFVYADGVNKVRLGSDQTNLTDLEMYYYKITKAYDSLSGRGIEDFPANLDLEPNINELRIVGPLQENPLGISSVRAGNGDGTGDNSIITITTANLQTKIESPHNFTVDTPIIIRGITESPTAYNGTFTVRQVVGLNTFTVVTPVIPSEVLPDPNTFEIATVSVESDTVSSSSPYVFNCSLRSVYGMCGMWADGAKSDGFKSMVVAQFTGVSLQKDDYAYMIYDGGIYYDELTLPQGSPLRPLYQNSRSIFKPDYENYHIRASNDAFIQAVSVFAIGYAQHFLTESGADMSITNSNSNFGANALTSIGFRKLSFDRDDTGYITHIIPPKELSLEENDISWLSLDINKIQDVANPKRLYIYSFNDKDVSPAYQVDGYRIGAKLNDKLYLTITGSESQTTYSAPIFMSTPGDSEGAISNKTYKVARTGSLNNVTTNTLTLTEPHRLFTGEKVRIFSDNAQVPEGLEIDKVYYAITTEVEPTLSPNEIRLAATLNDAISNQQINGLSNTGGILSVISTVSDKEPGEAGHPIQWDEDEKNWYINSSQFAQLNAIYSVITTINPITFGKETPTTFFKRIQEDRSIDDRLYKFRYVIPKDYINAKKPQVGYILQESKNVAITTTSVNEGSPLLNSTELRNDKLIVSAVADSVVSGKQVVTVTTELPHNFIPGDTVKIQGIKSVNNTSGIGIVSTYNGEFELLSVPSSRTFEYELDGVKINPGTFTNSVNQRATRQQRDALPLVSRQSYKNNFYVYRVDTIREYSPGQDGQDGIYHLVVVSSSVGISDRVGYGLSEKQFSQDIRNLYPQVDRDNPVSNPNATISYADLKVVGNVITDDKKKSLTLETVNEFNKNTRVGFGITNVAISGVGNTTLTIFTDVEHKLNSIKSISFQSNGTGYPTNTVIYSSNLLDNKLNEEDATCKFSTTVTGTIDTNTFKLVDVGTAHTVGETLSISGGTILNAVVTVSEIVNNIGDALELSGFHSTDLNGVYEIISVPNKKQIILHTPTGLSSFIPNTTNTIPIGYISSKGVGISSVVLSDLAVGIATVTTSYPHGLAIGNKFKLVGTGISFYDNRDLVVSNVLGISTFTVNVGVATTTSAPAKGKILKYGISSNSLNLGRGEENLASRACYVYGGLTVLSTSAIDINTSTLSVDSSSGIKRGDFLYINNEILRVSTTPTGNSFGVLRNQLGTVRTSAPSGSAIKKIKVLPVESRRPSFMRASGHTFEYLGYGPGNYSTALPQRQDRVLSDVEVLVSQAKKQEGGTIVYTGMNDLGESYTGSTKVSATTGEEVVIGAPILTYTGDDANGEIKDRQSGIFDEILVRDRITVEGGENNNQSSQFYGPVSFNKRITNLSQDGILLRNLFIRGSVSQEKLFTVGISTPTVTNIPTPINGDISYVSTPANNYVGFIYKNNEWRQWGPISIEPNKLSLIVDKLGIGATPTDSIQFNVGGNSQLQNLVVNGQLILNQPQTLKDITFEDIDVLGTATFYGYNPSTGVSTSYTQIHESGTSLLNQLEVIGVATFTKNVYINRPDEFGTIPTLFADKLDLANIRIGIANSNTIDTKFGGLNLASKSGNTTLNGNVTIVEGSVAITTSRISGIPSVGVVTAYITDSTILRLGVGNTNQTSYIDLNNDVLTFPNYSLRLVRNSGIGSQPSSLIHRGNQPLSITALDEGGEVRLLTNNSERLRVGASGTVTIFQDNSGENMRGGHLRLTQAGSGDAVLSWDITNNNLNRRWYCGIDTSDGYAWKLATPPTVLTYGDENFDNDTKIKVTTGGDLILTSTSGVSTFNASNITSSSFGAFNLVNNNISEVNAFGDANLVNIASNSITSRVNIRGTTESTSSNGGALVVSGGVGIGGNLWVGGTLGDTTVDGAFIVQGPNPSTLEGPTNITSTLNVDGVATFEDVSNAISPSTGSVRVLGGVGIDKDLWVGGSAWNLDVSGYLRVDTNSIFTGLSTVTNLTNTTAPTNGAFTVLGGVGIAQDLRVGGTIYGNLVGSVSGISTGTSNLLVNSSGDTGTWFVGLFGGSGYRPASIDSGITFNAATNVLSVTGDIIAFASDDRLKKNIKSIDNALSKVSSLSGFTFEFNDIGNSLGLKSDIRHSGVSAQQVEAILPEAVAPCPADDKYLTVKYDKLVPLLIEAIKDLKNELDDLKKKVQN
jgi:hypothetical protein